MERLGALYQQRLRPLLDRQRLLLYYRLVLAHLAGKFIHLG